MKTSVRTGLAGLLLLLTAAPAASAVDVSVRVEGDNATLVQQIVVTPSSSVKVDKTASGGTTCDGAKGGGALELATGGDWGGKAFSFGGPPSQAVEFIKGEAHPFSDPSQFWAFSVNNASSPVGVCDYEPQQGDELLFYAACGTAKSGCFDADPLDAVAPATAAPGATFAVRVDEYTSPFGKVPTKAPSAGATVTGGGATATTGADGRATVSLATRGPNVLTVSKGSRVRDEVSVCVTDGTDGFCGYAVPGAPTVPGGGGGGAGGPAADTRAPVSKIRGIRDGRRFKRRKGPRTLKATVADAGGIADVKLALTRSHRGRCFAFSGSKGRFVRIRCGRHPRFSVGDRSAVSFLLPARLKTGRYVLDVVATDRAGNRETLARGSNRVVFRVR